MNINTSTKYPPIAIGCCFYRRPNNYQAIIHSIEQMAFSYYGEVQAFIYFSGERQEIASTYIDKMKFEFRNMFTFDFGHNRLAEPKYMMPLISDKTFIFTIDDDCVFERNTLTVLMDTYQNIQDINYENSVYTPVGWFGTVLNNGELITPIEGRYNLRLGEIQQVDYLGSCGCLYRREILEDKQLIYENWPSFIGAASDLWLSFLIDTKYKVTMYITGLNKIDLPEFGHSLWDDHNKKEFQNIVKQLVLACWGK